MFQAVCFFLMLISSCLGESEVPELLNVDPDYCYQGICDGAIDPESILRGPVYQLGNFTDCLYRRKQQYCLANIQLYSGDRPSEFWLYIQNLTAVRINFRRDILYVGICVPESSTSEDVSMAMVDTLEPAAASLGIHAAIRVEPENCQIGHQKPITASDISFGVVLLVIVTAVIAGTIYDSDIFKKGQLEKQNCTAQEVLLCFSLTKNWKKIKSSKISRNLASVEGIRAIISFIAVLIHAGYFTVNGAVANMEWFEEAYNSRYKVMLIHVHAHIVFFICMSGFLTGYTASRQMDERKFTFFHYIKMVGCRYLRYCSLLVFLIAFSSTWLNYFGSGPLWPSLVTSEVQNCRQNWWINVLYLNNYINVDRQCMLHTWYIASDFQNYVVSLFVLMMMYKYQKWSRVIAGFVLFTYVIIPFLQTYMERLNPTFICIPESIRHIKEDPTFARSYISFHGNAAPYFIGVIFGCMFFKMIKEGTTLSKAGVIGIWTASFALPIGSMFTYYELYRPEYEYNIFTASIYAALHKAIYALGVAAILLMCCTGHGWIFRSIFSWKYFQALGLFTYGIYLTHFTLQRISTGSLKEPVTVSMDNIMNKSVMDFLTAFVLSAVLQLCVQLPVENLCELKIYSGSKMSE